jgi:hypothetical protein
MMSQPSEKQTSMSQLFRELEILTKSSNVTLDSVIKHAGFNGHFVVIFFFSLPFVIPMPLPGLSIPIGVAITALGIAIIANKNPWLPSRIRDHKVSQKTLSKIFGIAARALRWLEKIPEIGPANFTQLASVRVTGGFLITLCGLLLAAPLPPGTNFLPALCVAILSAAYVEENFLLLIFGFIAFVLNGLFFFALAFLGFEGFKLLF